MSITNPRSIRRIDVEGLFGLYDYSLHIPEATADDNRILILYGDNGSGKTTILKLAFHLLAPEDSAGHKTAVARIPFRRFEIELLDRTKVTAERAGGQMTGSFTAGVKRFRRKLVTAEFIAETEGRVRVPARKEDAEITAFYEALRELDIGLYMLSDDRQIHLAGRQGLQSLHVAVDSAGQWIAHDALQYRAVARQARLEPEKIAQHLLAQSIQRAEEWIRGRAMMDSSAGESSVNALYDEILKRVVAEPERQLHDSKSTRGAIIERVGSLKKQSSAIARYGLMPEFQGRGILTAVKEAKPDQLTVVADVLNPYLESLEKKLEALAETYRRVDALVSVIGRFLTDKSLTFHLHSGIQVATTDGTVLGPETLSSGERHLLLLFCNSLVAVDSPSIMMIDEPEISLNVKWQRMLLAALLECIGDSPVQYVFATHSMELLAKHRGRVVKLENQMKN